VDSWQPCVRNAYEHLLVEGRYSEICLGGIPRVRGNAIPASAPLLMFERIPAIDTFSDGDLAKDFRPIFPFQLFALFVCPRLFLKQLSPS